MRVALKDNASKHCLRFLYDRAFDKNDSNVLINHSRTSCVYVGVDRRTFWHSRTVLIIIHEVIVMNANGQRLLYHRSESYDRFSDAKFSISNYKHIGAVN